MSDTVSLARAHGAGISTLDNQPIAGLNEELHELHPLIALQLDTELGPQHALLALRFLELAETGREEKIVVDGVIGDDGRWVVDVGSGADAAPAVMAGTGQLDGDVMGFEIAKGDEREEFVAVGRVIGVEPRGRVNER